MTRPLHLNLASRPFHNNVPIWVAHGLVLAAVIAFSAWNAHAYLGAKRKLGALRENIGSTEKQLSDLERREQEAQKGIQAFDYKVLEGQAQKANDIILRRGLSWTQLFNILERVVPYEDRMTAVRPVYGTREAATRGKGSAQSFEGTVPIDVEGVAQSLEAFLELERALIVDPHFANVEPVRTEVQPGNGEVKFQLHFLYDPDGRLGQEHPKLDHVLDAAKKAAAEGGEASQSALDGLR